MPSSTSSSDDHVSRSVPPRSWLRLAAIAASLTLLATTAWEVHARRLGFGPSYQDDADLWAREHRKVEPESLVAIGSSRILFDLDLDVVENGLGRRPVQLARVGSSPRPVLRHLAEDQSFHGTVLVGFTPPLYFVGGGPPAELQQAYVDHYPRQTPSDRWGKWLAMRLEERLAFLKVDLELRSLLGHVPLPPRRDYRPPPSDPPYFGRTHADRRETMVPSMETDVDHPKRIQDAWRAILAAAPPLPEDVVEGIRQQVLTESRRDVEAIRSRGGRVIFIRFPSTDVFREAERRMTPRERYWDALLDATGAPGIHFEDHPALQGYTLPEWSHLTEAEARRFTEELLPLLRPHLD